MADESKDDKDKELRFTITLKRAPNGAPYYDVKHKRKPFVAPTLDDVLSSLRVLLKKAEGDGLMGGEGTGA